MSIEATPIMDRTHALEVLSFIEQLDGTLAGYSDIHFHLHRPVAVRYGGGMVTIDGLIVTPDMIDAVYVAFGVIDWKLRLKAAMRIVDAGVIFGERFRLQGSLETRVDTRSTSAQPIVKLRRLSKKIPKLRELGLPTTVLRMVNTFSGLVLVAGATGSGKSTTLASIIDVINTNMPMHISTVEDPVEYTHVPKKSVITQKQIGHATDTFPNALRDLLREDPDVILVGEIRDAETMSVALRAAETGHLVLGTVHSAGAVSTINRVINFFPKHEHEAVLATLSESLKGVIAQRLMPRQDKVGERVLAYEIMGVNRMIATLIKEGKLLQLEGSLSNPGTGPDVDKDNMVLLNDVLLRLVKAKQIDVASAVREAYNPLELMKSLREQNLMAQGMETDLTNVAG